MLHLPCSVLSGSHILGLCGVKMLNLTGKVDSMGQYLLCVMEEKGCYMDKQVFYADETGLFLQDH